MLIRFRLMIPRLIKIMLPCIIILLVREVRGQFAETIASDRPCATNAATTVGARVLQIQVGGDFTQLSPTNKWDRGFMGGSVDAAIRIGILERFELNFATGYLNLNSNTRTYSDQEDFNFAIRARANVLKSDGAIPAIGLYAEAIFPKKGTANYTDNIGSRFLLLIEQQIESRIKLSSNIGMYVLGSPQLHYTLNLSVAVSPIATIYVEHYGLYFGRYSPDLFALEPVRHDFWYPRVNGGVAFLVGHDLQLDIQSGFGKWLVGALPQKDWNVGAGISYRLRFKKNHKDDTAK